MALISGQCDQNCYICKIKNILCLWFLSDFWSVWPKIWINLHQIWIIGTATRTVTYARLKNILCLWFLSDFWSVWPKISSCTVYTCVFQGLDFMCPSHPEVLPVTVTKNISGQCDHRSPYALCTPVSFSGLGFHVPRPPRSAAGHSDHKYFWAVWPQISLCTVYTCVFQWA